MVLGSVSIKIFIPICLKRHKLSVHECEKYGYGQCDYEARQVSHIIRIYMNKGNMVVISVNIRLHRKTIKQNINIQYIKVEIIAVTNVNISWSNKVILERIY